MRKIATFLAIFIAAAMLISCSAQVSAPKTSTSMTTADLSATWSELTKQTPNPIGWYSASISKDYLCLYNDKYLCVFTVEQNGIALRTMIPSNKLDIHVEGDISTFFVPNRTGSKLAFTNTAAQDQIVHILDIDRNCIYDLGKHKDSALSMLWSDTDKLALLDSNGLRTFDCQNGKEQAANHNDKGNTLIGSYQDSWMLALNTSGEAVVDSVYSYSEKNGPLDLQLKGSVCAGRNGLVAVNKDAITYRTYSGEITSYPIPQGYSLTGMEDGKLLFHCEGKEPGVWSEATKDFKYFPLPVNDVKSISPNGKFGLALGVDENSSECLWIVTNDKTYMKLLPPDNMTKPSVVEQMWVNDNELYTVWIPNNNNQFDGLVLQKTELDTQKNTLYPLSIPK